MDSEDEEYHSSQLLTKGKSKKWEILELKPRRRRQGKCVGAALEIYDLIANENQMEEDVNKQEFHNFISNDIWFHLAKHVAPEDVLRFSLICSQSANSLYSRRFWLLLYRRYCQQTFRNNKKWILSIPEDLQMDNIKDCDLNVLRQRVIQALFYCYPPFKKRLQTPYTLTTLVGRTCVSSWHKQVQCVWIMCLKFKLNFPLHNATKTTQKSQNKIESIGEDYAADSVVDDWQYLVEKENNPKKGRSSSSSATNFEVNNLDGVCLLVIRCDRFVPFGTDIIYNHGTSSFRLSAARELLSTDMRSKNLELDFISQTRNQTITVKYTKIEKFDVLPWWHPDFSIMNQCE